MPMDIGALQDRHIDIGALQAEAFGLLYVSNIDTILNANLDGTYPEVIIRDEDQGLSMYRPTFMDIDALNNKLFFILPYGIDKFRTCDLDGSDLETVSIIWGNQGTTFSSIAINNSSSVVESDEGRTFTGPEVFVTDYTNKRIGRGDIVKHQLLGSTDFFTTILITDVIKTTSYAPWVAKYDEINELLFWTEANGKIYKSLPDGSSTELLFSNVNYLSLAIDPFRRKIYYVGRDYYLGKTYEGILQANYDGTEKTFLVYANRSLLGGLGFHSKLNHLYFLTNGDELYRKDLSTTPFGGSTLLLDASDGISRPVDVKINSYEPTTSLAKQKSLFISGIDGTHGAIDTPPVIPPGEGTPDPDPDSGVGGPLNLFLAVPEGVEQAIDFFIGSPKPTGVIGLFINGPVEEVGTLDFFLKTTEYETANVSLYIKGYRVGTRLYLPGASAPTQFNNPPSPNTGWQNIDSYTTLRCDTVKIGSEGGNDITIDEYDEDTNINILKRQYISRPLTPGQIITVASGAYTHGVFQGKEYFHFNGMFLAYTARIVGSSGQLRKPLVPSAPFDDTVRRLGPELPVDPLDPSSRRWSASVPGEAYTTVLGDCVVIELGVGGNPIVGFGGTFHSFIRVGDASYFDLPHEQPNSSMGDPWVQLWDTLTFEEYGAITDNNQFPLFIHGVEESTSSKTLFTHGYAPVNRSMTLTLTYPSFDIAEIDLFLKTAEPTTDSIDLFLKAPEPINSSIGLSIHGDENSTNSIDLFLRTHEDVTDSSDLFIWGKNSINNSIGLLFHYPSFKTVALDLFLKVPEPINGSITLFIHGVEDFSQSIGLYLAGQVIYDEVSLYIRGASSSLGDDNFGQRIEFLWLKGGYYPQLMGRFTTDVASATIEIWEVGDGSNTPVVLLNTLCYPIGNTGRWGWSTRHFKELYSKTNHFVFRMTGNNLEEFLGEFILVTGSGDNYNLNYRISD